ncbi:MAG: hypothetical protein KGJ59_04110 [Bacteroidota bacterium]|nr:hypothetical protein [Bacteroidota bacterium]
MLAYSITQQIKQSLVDKNYLNGMKDSFALLRKTSDMLTADLAKSYLETLQKYSQLTRGSLNQFLSTPIKSDEEEVRRIIKENFERFGEQHFDMVNTGVQRSWQSRLITEPALFVSRDKNVKKLFGNGKKLLVQFGIVTGKIPSAVFESVFIFPSPQGLTHLKKVIDILPDDEFEYLNSPEMRSANLYQIVNEAGTPPSNLAKGGTVTQWEIMLYPKLRSTDLKGFDNKCADLFSRLTSELNIQHIALWKRLLGLSGGSLYSMRLTTIPDIQMLTEIIRWLAEKSGSEMRSAVITNGGLVVKEILW